MDLLVLTKTGGIFGPIAEVLGWIMDALFRFTSAFGVMNIGLCIILFTLVMKLLMFPLTLNQQKSSKLMAVMQPEIQAIQKKYKGKTDNDSMMKMNVETRAVYEKYGTSMTGGCLPLLIQLPIMLALYQVIYHIPGYITGVRNVFTGLTAKIMSVDGFGSIISQFLTDNKITMTGISANTEFTKTTTIDFLYKLSPSQLEKFSQISDFSGFSDLFDKVAQQTSHMNTFLNLNISDTPLAIIKSGMAQGGAAGYLLVFSAAMVPILAWLTQWMNYKLMPQPKQAPNSEPSAMEASMKSMNTFMPIMSAVFCFSFPVGIGIYWVIGAVIRCIQQLVINRKMEQMDMEDLVRRNQEKMKKKMEKRGVSAQQINQQARMNARNIQAPDKTSGLSQEEKAAQRKKATEYYNNANVKPGSLAAKANMVKQFDEKNAKKK